MSTPKISPLALAGAIAFVLVYFGVLVLFGIWLSGTLVSLTGLSLTSNLGLSITIVGAVLYISFELFILFNMRPPPVMNIMLAVVMTPLIISRGFTIIGKEFDRIQDLLADIPSILSHIMPAWAKV